MVRAHRPTAYGNGHVVTRLAWHSRLVKRDTEASISQTFFLFIADAVEHFVVTKRSQKSCVHRRLLRDRVLGRSRSKGLWSQKVHFSKPLGLLVRNGENPPHYDDITSTLRAQPTRRPRRTMTSPAELAEHHRPWLVQGGMGIAISHWPLARAVALSGQLGVVSGTGIETVFVRRLQDHGVDEGLRAVLDRFPLQSVVDDVLAKYAAKRRSTGSPYKAVPMLSHRNVQSSHDLLVLAAYCEVAQAKAGHDGLVGINLLPRCRYQRCRHCLARCLPTLTMS